MRTSVTNKLTIVLTTFVLLTQPVFGQVIFGGSDCGEWLSNQAEHRKAWALGFMSGMSMTTHYFGTHAEKANGDWLNKVNSAHQILLFIDNYCQKNPLKRVESAGFALYFELTSK